MQENSSIRIAPKQMHERFRQILLGLNFSQERANAIAEIFTMNSTDGIYTHGVNRFPVFVQYVKLGHVITGATPMLHHKFGALEQWNGNKGPGTLNAIHATD